MKYAEFYEKFGKSYRQKHILKQRIEHLFKYFKGEYNKHNKRLWTLPKKSELPEHYLRLDPWEAEYLFYQASVAKVGILETGRWCGGSAFLMSYANPNVPIHSIDIDPQDDEKLKGYFEKHNVGKKVDLIVGDSQQTKYDHIGKYDLLWIDGDHSYEGCTYDLENWFPDLESGGHVILHDCYHGSPVKESVIDFIEKHKDQVDVIVHPYKNSTHWHCPEGSLTHFRKK